MFGTNEIVGRKYFQKPGGLVVTSMFATLQGEGPFAGRPAIFVRLAKCNLACHFCDTFFDDGEWFNTEDLENAIHRKHKPEEESRWGIVITGGEPALQVEIVQLLRQLANDDFTFLQIETNGTLPLQALPLKTTLVVSPKCLEVNLVPTRYLAPNEAVLDRADCLKFLMSADPQSPYHEIPQWAFEWHEQTGKPIYLSPIAVYLRKPDPTRRMGQGLYERSRAERISFWEPGLYDLKAVQANHEYAAGYAIEHGLWLSIQQQLFASIP